MHKPDRGEGRSLRSRKFKLVDWELKERNTLAKDKFIPLWHFSLGHGRLHAMGANIL